ncbi:hypothetical protein TGAM01_v210971 [Trichoderma gamsii]|uniref:BTB domain-containing protein n=2 Tax=Trichoderma gamsii TaxID=398673 RepID=A0A2P4Z779_9HYPO|nr:hypothetical protein TGAM01_v210971 [Trichoderma gamsii]PON20149.1 hypothetical protein TGAM01_v210971 [Trichoderma gamsii]
MKSTESTALVGERRFTTTRNTLVGESVYFRARLSGSWNDADEDGSYFVDADPTLFEHVLRYLRRGNPPLFFNVTTQSHDYAMYLALLGEAKYFGISKLEDWIQNERYLAAVRVRYSIDIFGGSNIFQALPRHFNTVNANTKFDFSYALGSSKVFVCPRAVAEYRGHPERCGAKCNKTRNGLPAIFEDEPRLQVACIKTEVLFEAGLGNGSTNVRKFRNPSSCTMQSQF